MKKETKKRLSMAETSSSKEDSLTHTNGLGTDRGFKYRKCKYTAMVWVCLVLPSLPVGGIWHSVVRSQSQSHLWQCWDTLLDEGKLKYLPRSIHRLTTCIFFPLSTISIYGEERELEDSDIWTFKCDFTLRKLELSAR